MEMIDVGYFFANLYQQVFLILDLEVPVFHISVWRLWVGVLCVTITVRILRIWLWDDVYQSNVDGNYQPKSSIRHYGLHSGLGRK